MSIDRRTVRATASFFSDLDRLLPPERTTDDQPSRSDFQTSALRIVDQFALGFG